MKFRNTNPSSPLSFECGGTQYDVAVGGTCDIPDRFAYAVESMRLQLEPVDETKPEAPAPAPDPKTEKPEAKASQQPKK